MSVQRKKILLFPLANVLGHVSRTLALAEELHKAGQEVYVAASDDYANLFSFVDPGITVLPNLEMFADATKVFGQISYAADGTLDESELLRLSTHLEGEELERRSEQLKRIIKRDTQIIETIRPDAMVIDYHFAPLLIPSAKGIPVFCISHRIGYPTFCKRVKGEFPYPFNKHTVLVPGISDFELTENDLLSCCNEWVMCGTFSWEGWQRMPAIPKKNDVFLFFGSTGCSEQLTPWFKEKLQSRYSLSYQEKGDQLLHLGTFLKQTSVVLCHGGHGTIMECIRYQKPMIIVPNNLEQLELGRRVEELKLGVLIAKPYDQIDADLLSQSIEKLRKDHEVKENLERFSVELRKSDGAKVAAAFIADAINDSVEEASALLSVSRDIRFQRFMN